MMSPLAYFSVTGQTRRFIDKSGVSQAFEIKRFASEYPAFTENFILVVPTYVQAITQPVTDFLEAHDNYRQCAGIFGSGNRNFGSDFCLTAKELSKTFNLPLLHLYEFQGNDDDIAKLREEVAKLEN